MLVKPLNHPADVSIEREPPRASFDDERDYTYWMLGLGAAAIFAGLIADWLK